MRSDDIKPRPEAAHQHPGEGMALTFLCPKCSTPKRTLGRRKVAFRGLRQFLCAGCLPVKVSA